MLNLNSTTTLLATLTLLVSALATTTTDRSSIQHLFRSVVEDLIDGYRTRTDLAGTRSMTKVIEDAERRGACTVTVEWMNPEAAETFTVPVEMTCLQTGVPGGKDEEEVVVREKSGL